MAEEKRTRRTPEEMAAARDQKIAELEESIRAIEEKKAEAVAAFDEKIAAVNAKIEKIKEQKKAALAPKKRKPRRTKTEKIQQLIKQARKSGMKPEEIAEKLGIEIGE